MVNPEPAPRAKKIGTYSISVDDVSILVLDVAIPDTADAEAPADTASMTVDVVQQYIQMITDQVAAQFYEGERITDQGRQRSLNSSLRLAVLNIAAGYTENAAHAASDGVNSTTAGDKLIARGELILASEQMVLTKWLTEGGVDVDPEPGLGQGSGIAFSFPTPAIPDSVRY